MVDAFRAAGLEVGDTIVMGKKDYGMAPITAAEGTRFLIPSIGPDNGGRILSFTNETDLQILKGYYDHLGEISPLFFSWTFVHDNILLQINGSLPQDRALQYQAALDQLK